MKLGVVGGATKASEALGGVARRRWVAVRRQASQSYLARTRIDGPASASSVPVAPTVPTEPVLTATTVDWLRHRAVRGDINGRYTVREGCDRVTQTGQGVTQIWV